MGNFDYLIGRSNKAYSPKATVSRTKVRVLLYVIYDGSADGPCVGSWQESTEAEIPKHVILQNGVWTTSQVHFQVINIYI